MSGRLRQQAYVIAAIRKKAAYEVYCRISLGALFIPSTYKSNQIYLCKPCLKKLSGKIAKQLQNEGD